jgi:hypothetical protein
MVSTSNGSDPLTIGGRLFGCRLLTGTGKYPSIGSMQRSIERSACEMVTVAVRRVQTGAAGHAGLMEAIDWSRHLDASQHGGMHQCRGSYSRRATGARTRQIGRPRGQQLHQAGGDSRQPTPVYPIR